MCERYDRLKNILYAQINLISSTSIVTVHPYPLNTTDLIYKNIGGQCMNNSIFMVFAVLAVTLEAVWLSTNYPPPVDDKKNEQNQQTDKFEVFKNVLEVVVLLISLLR